MNFHFENVTEFLLRIILLLTCKSTGLHSGAESVAPALMEPERHQRQTHTVASIAPPETL